ncbi:MAG: hypothetical protein ACD_2C00219G0003 [uncultured bacterium (gcode 4)]|uniref:Uncharacterized protein n=1 Tax=uncultured bacterium (gcode 4) TaxID=1234023 RepID=K2FDK5_9BACT|nr:MAG: hypothetical protein ACD_2C00219G0003 [uncultured bacterium (gcode 4)]
MNSFSHILVCIWASSTALLKTGLSSSISKGVASPGEISNFNRSSNSFLKSFKVNLVLFIDSLFSII